MNKTILHCDLNSFYASVELLSRPDLINKPVAVAGDPKLRHGIILARNEIAKSFGVRTPETIWSAKSKCPNLILLPADHSKYELYSTKANELYSRFTNKVEPFGIDESWLDVTASKKFFGSGVEIADKIRQDLKSELGLTASVGVSFNKVFSKLGSDYKKPDATTEISYDNFKIMIYDLPVTNLLFVGKSTLDSLRKLKILTIGELANCDKKLIVNLLGKHGESIHDYANGISDDEVRYYGDYDKPKSISNAITFKRDLLGLEDIKVGLSQLAENISIRLREEDLKFLTISITVKSKNFELSSRQKTIEHPTSSHREILHESVSILKSFWDIDEPIRMLGIAVSNFSNISSPQQMNLFDKPEKSKRKIEEAELAFLKIKKTYGSDAITFGNFLDSDLKD